MLLNFIMKDDSELCVLPVTCDVVGNPFRFRKQKLEESALLFQTILALCSQHQNHLATISSVIPSVEATEHRAKASQMLEYACRSDQVATTGLRILDPILVMFTLT